jgi:cytochrome c553
MLLRLRWTLATGLAACLVETVPAQGMGLDSRLKERLVQCGACHGEDGNSRIENLPSLAGQPEFFVMNQLFLMREGVRRVEAMAPFVRDLKDDELQALATHYSRLAPKPSGESIDGALVRRGAALAASMRCASCHLPNLAGQDQMPRLAMQRVDYLIYSLKAFRDNKRSGADTIMSAAVIGIPDADLAALAHYAASLR